MQRFTQILFVNEPSVNTLPALQRAVRLAKTNGAKLTILTIGQELPRTFLNMEKTFTKIHKDQLATLLGKIDTTGLDITEKYPIGRPFIEVISEVIGGGHDLVIKPAEGRGGLSNMLFGSTDMHLMRKCPCPVWVIKPTKRKKYTRILAAVDPDPSEEENARLNALIIELASSLSSSDGSELHIVHAWEMIYEGHLLSGRASISSKDIDKLVKDTRKAHKQWFNDLLSHHDLSQIKTRTHLLKGEPDDVISTLAQKKRVELIVMGTVARTGIPGFFIGNTAEKTLAKVDCSVLALKPDNFSTPIQVG